MGITKKQKEVYDYIREYAHTHGYAPTQKEIKEHFGLKSFGSVQRYIKYLTDAGYLVNAENACRGLAINSSSSGPEAPKSSSMSGGNSYEIPLLGDVAAGNPIEAIESPDNYLSVPLEMIDQRYGHFALTVSGDSMIEDGILENDYVVCKGQSTAHQGQTVVAVINGEATIKKFYKQKGHFELHPANRRLSPIIVDQDSGDFKIVGVLVGLIRTFV